MLAVVGLATSGQLPAQVTQGWWEMAFNHNNGISLPSAPVAAGGATNPYAPLGTIEFYGQTTALGPVLFQYPTKMNAVHMALIPRGPNRGRVLVWDDAPVILKSSNFDPQNFWAYQAFAIVDPDYVLDPVTNPSQVRFQNFLLPMRPIALNGEDIGGDLFCAGHTWSPDGDLIVAGGTEFTAGNFSSGSGTFAFAPDKLSAPFPGLGAAPLYPGQFGLWARGPHLEHGRYYPTTVLTNTVSRPGNPQITPPTPAFSGHTVVVLGGGTAGAAGTSPSSWNSYEGIQVVARPALVSGIPDSGLVRDRTGLGPNEVFTFPGPSAGSNINLDWLQIYPRAHVVDGEVFVSGWAIQSSHLNPAATIWGPTPRGHQNSGVWSFVRFYGSSFRFPNVGGNDNLIVRLGGYRVDAPLSSGQPSLAHATNTVEVCQANQNNSAWVNPAPSGSPLNMTVPRAWLNVVLLPDASIMAFGGADMQSANLDLDPPTGVTPHFIPEIFRPGAASWAALAGVPAQSVRDYHSTALLLPDGRVLVAGGNRRGIDYEVYCPPYLEQEPRPDNVVILSPSVGPSGAVEVPFGAEIELQCDELPFGVSLQKAVLMAPGSVTHHSDMSQRYHQLTTAPAGNTSLKCYMPATELALLPGFYMLFVVTNSGAVSKAVWVKLS